MQLRWMVKRNPGVTAAQVRDLRDKTNVSMEDAKMILLRETKPVLQYRVNKLAEWKDVPLEVIPHEA